MKYLILEKLIGKMANDKPGKDLATGLWIKKLPSVKYHLKVQLKKLITCQIEKPDWLITTKTILIAKNNETMDARNYRPIALQKAIYKIYTENLAEFISDHCHRNSIITEEQVTGKKQRMH